MKKYLSLIFLTLVLLLSACMGPANFIPDEDITQGNSISVEMMVNSNKLLFLDSEAFEYMIRKRKSFIMFEMNVSFDEVEYPFDSVESSSQFDGYEQVRYLLLNGVCLDEENFICQETSTQRVPLFFGSIYNNAYFSRENSSGSLLTFYRNGSIMESNVVDPHPGGFSAIFAQNLASQINEKVNLDSSNQLSNLDGFLDNIYNLSGNRESISSYVFDQEEFDGHFYKLKELIDNEEDFILLLTSQSTSSYRLFGAVYDDEDYETIIRYDDVEEDISEVRDPFNICNQITLDGSNSFCDIYKSTLLNLSSEGNFKYYHINVDNIEKEWLALFTAFIYEGSPGIGIYQGGVLQDHLVGVGNSFTIRNYFIKKGII